MGPKISVIVPAYNVEKYLPKCLDSIMQQTYTDLEIIAIDDGSPDRCGEIIDEYAQRDKRIVPIHKENGGLSAGWNDGMAIASGEWIAFVDSDDWIDVTYFENLMQGADDKLDVVLANGYYIEDEENGMERNVQMSPIVFEYGEGKDILRVRTLVPHLGDKKMSSPAITYVWNKLYRSALIREIGITFDPKIRAGLGNDALFNFQVFGEAQTVASTSCCGYHYRVTASSGTRKYSPSRPADTDYLVSRLFAEADNKHMSKEILGAIEAYSLSNIANNLKFYYFHENRNVKFNVIANEIKLMKQMPAFHRAITSSSIIYLTKKQLVLRFALRLPWVWPLRLIYSINQVVS